MALQVINVGTAPNDGTGDPLRTAYIKCNTNFAEIYSRAQTSPPLTLIGTPGDQAGMYAYDSSFWYYCYANYDGVSTIWAQISQIGNISVTQIINGTSSVKISDSAGNANISIGGISNVAVFATTGQYVTGEVSASGNITGAYILGDGSLLTGIPSSYTDSNVVTLLATFGSNTVSTTGTITGGNITGGNILTSGLVSGAGNVTGGNVRTAGLVTATGNITGGNIRTAGVVSATGNISGNYFIGNGSLLTGISGGGSSYTDSNVVTLLAAFGSNTVSTTGTITGGNITGGNILTGGLVSSTGNIASAANVSGGNLLATTTISAASHIGSVVSVTANVTGGNLLTSGLISATSTITGTNLLTSGIVSATSNITGGNVLTGGLISATGNISAAGNVSAAYFIGDGSQLTGLPTSYGNTQVAAYLPTYTGDLNPSNVSVYLNQTIGGNLTVTGTTSAVGNINARTINGQLVGTTNGINPIYLIWDFGSITGLTFQTPIAWIFAQTSAGNIDMGTISAPSTYEIDIGTIY